MRALYIQWRIDVGTKSLIILIAPVSETIFLDNLSIYVCHRRFSAIQIPSDFTSVTFSIGKVSIESLGWLDKVLNFCLDPISINSVLAVFKVSLLKINRLFRLPKSWFKFNCIEFASTSRGSRIVPWGTPHLSEQILQKEPLTRHPCVRFVKYDLNQSRALPCFP